MERVQKIIAAAGVSSRRQAEVLIITGRVTVNGEVITLLGTRVDPATDIVAVDGKPITLPEKRTLLLHKPAGVVTTCDDPHARDTVMKLAPKIPGLHPIGRLDKDTTGLLLLTNDGDLTYALTHPKHHVDKTYHAWVEGIVTPEQLAPLNTGIELSDGMTFPAEVKRLATRGTSSLVSMVIHEGRKRQVRRMLQAVGAPVISLKRERVGPLTLGELPEGQWRDLEQREVAALFRAAGVAPAQDE